MAILLLLQVHGRLTAPELARRLETSVRTVRRDLDALSSAGVPVYPQRGRGGGWSLLGGHRIDLTGLTAEEAQALFLATGSASSSELGPSWSEGLSAARRKVMAALPDPVRAQVEAVGATTLVDRSRWGRQPEPAGAAGPDETHLGILRRATVAGLEVAIEYEPPGRPAEERTIQPRGLVCKRGVWYPVGTAPAGLRTYRVSQVRAARLTGTPVRGSPGSDLAAAWEGIQRAGTRWAGG